MIFKHSAIDKKAGDRLLPFRFNVFGVIVILFFLSGVSALIYQVVWVRMAGLVFGVAPFSVSTVLSSFMTGLSLGSLFFGKIVDKSKNSLKLFGVVEIGIGGFALIFPVVLSKITHSYIYLYLHLHTNFYLFSLFRFFIIFLLLLIPTFLMGGTLPILSKFSVQDLKLLGKRVGILYSINNLGAVAGCFLAGFFLIRWIGLSRSIYIGATLNILIGISALVMSRFLSGSSIFRNDTGSRLSGSPSSIKIKSAIKREDSREEEWEFFKIIVLLAVFTLTGFISMVYEVVWTRILSASVFANSVYSFSTVVITFILGIALGSLIYTKFLDKKRNKFFLFGNIEFAIGVSTLLLLPAFDRVPYILGKISPALFGAAPSWSFCILSEFIPAFLLMIIPTTLLGITFPLISRIYTRNVNELGSKIGIVNTLDTMGPIFGSFTAGFFFIPFVGMQRSIVVLSLVSIGMGAVIIFFAPSITKKIKGGILAGIIVFALLTVIFVPFEFNFWRKGRVPGERLLYYKEDVAATVVVREYPEGTRLNRILEVDGTDVAGTDYMLKSTQKLQGHLPLLIHPNPKKVLIVGFGSGGTTWAVAQHDVEKIEAVELVAGVVEAAKKYFEEVNHGVINDPRLTVKIGDGRNFVLTTTQHYDVILTESIHPIYAGNGNLYAKEYFELCKKKLSPDGIMGVWVPLWALPQEHFKMIVKTFREVFPNCSLWYVPNCLNRQVYLIGSKGTFQINFESFQKRIRQQNISKDLAEIGMDDPFLLLGSFLMGPDSLQKYTEGSAINTDDHPRLEYFDYPYLEFYPEESFHVRTVYENLEAIQRFRENIIPFLINIAKTKEEEKKIKDALNIYWESTRHTIEGVIYSLKGELRLAIQAFGEAIKINPHDKSAKRLLIHLLEYFYVNRGNELQYMGDVEGAILSYKKALEVNPESIAARYNLALAYLRKGMRREAMEELRKILEISGKMEKAKKLLEELEKF